MSTSPHRKAPSLRSRGSLYATIDELQRQLDTLWGWYCSKHRDPTAKPPKECPLCATKKWRECVQASYEEGRIDEAKAAVFDELLRESYQKTTSCHLEFNAPDSDEILEWRTDGSWRLTPREKGIPNTTGKLRLEWDWK